jgi:hypothetical protein
VIYIVEVESHLSSTLSVQQTPSRPQTEPPKKTRIVADKSLQKKSAQKTGISKLKA